MTMKKILIITLLITGFTSCNNFDEEINKNPNQPSTASNTQLLANAMMWLPGTQASASGVLYAQHVSEAEYITLSRYDNVFYNFYNWYSGPLMNLEEVLTSDKLDANEGPIANQLAVAKIMKVYFYWYMTDRWGDLPYSKALKGNSNFTPTYDTQEEIYGALFTLLDEANAEIVTGDIDNDIIYQGNMTRWKKLANTLHMLMALRLSKVDDDRGAIEFNKALGGGIFSSNTDNLVFQHLSDPDNWNYWYDVFEELNREWYAISKPLADYMIAVEDPRLPVFANTNEDGDYVGLEYGLQGDQVNTGAYAKKKISIIGDAVRQATSPVYLITYAQALFAKAEAAKLGWITGGDAEAEASYTLAIEKSLEQWNDGDNSGLATMMGHPEVAYNPAKALEQIGYQRWVHLYMNGYEAWAEWRRTGFPVLQPPANNGDRQIPRREAYPTQEAQNNTANYNDAVQRLGGTNDLNGRVWWDD
jgi:hypothetical protein